MLKPSSTQSMEHVCRACGLGKQSYWCSAQLMIRFRGAVTRWLRGQAAHATEYLSTKDQPCSCLSTLPRTRFMVLCMTLYGKWSLLHQQVQLCELISISGGLLRGGSNIASVSIQHRYTYNSLCTRLTTTMKQFRCLHKLVGTRGLCDQCNLRQNSKQCTYATATASLVRYVCSNNTT